MARRDSQSHAGRAQAVARRLRETARGNVRGRVREALVGGEEGLRMADAARVWAICSRSHGEAPVDGEWVCDGQTRQERGRAVFGRAGKRRSAGERGLRMADAARVRMSRSRSRPGSVTVIGIVGKTGSANAGKGMRGGQGKPLPGSGLCGGAGGINETRELALTPKLRKNGRQKEV